MSRQVALIDMSWVMHRAAHVCRDMNVSHYRGSTYFTGHIYGVLSTVRLFLQNPDMEVVLVIDGFPKKRAEEAFKEGLAYKAGRGESEHDFKRDVGDIISMATCHPRVFYSYLADHESDDVLHVLSRRYMETHEKVLIHSGDNDMIQSITEDSRVVLTRNFDKWKNPIEIQWGDVKTGESFVKKFMGVTPDKILWFRSAVGDASDKIYGITRIRKAPLAEVVLRSETFADMFESRPGDSSKVAKVVSQLVEYRDIVMRNYRLMRLYDELDGLQVSRRRVSREVVSGLIDKFEMRSWLEFLRSEGANL